jgi:hypothetical protein
MKSLLLKNRIDMRWVDESSSQTYDELTIETTHVGGQKLGFLKFTHLRTSVNLIINLQ